MAGIMRSSHMESDFSTKKLVMNILGSFGVDDWNF